MLGRKIERVGFPVVPQPGGGTAPTFSIGAGTNVAPFTTKCGEL